MPEKEESFLLHSCEIRICPLGEQKRGWQLQTTLKNPHLSSLEHIKFTQAEADLLKIEGMEKVVVSRSVEMLKELVAKTKQLDERPLDGEHDIGPLEKLFGLMADEKWDDEGKEEK